MSLTIVNGVGRKSNGSEVGMTRQKLLSEICPTDCIRDDICEVHDCSDICYPLLNKILDKYDRQIRKEYDSHIVLDVERIGSDAVEEFADYLKKHFRIGVNTIDDVVKEYKEQKNE